MTPVSNFNNGILGSLLVISGTAISKAASVDYKTLLKICITIVTLMAGWGINHLINCMDKIDANQLAIVVTQGDIKAKIAASDEWTKGQFIALNKTICDHINVNKK
jgi:hypothetical protein